MSRQALGILDQLAEREQRSTVDAATLYRSMILAGGPNADDAADLQTIMVTLGITADDVKADVKATERLRDAEAEHARFDTPDARAARQRATVEALAAFDDYFDPVKRVTREDALRAAVGNAQAEQRRADSASRTAGDARRELVANHPRLVAPADRPTPVAPAKSVGGVTFRQTRIEHHAAPAVEAIAS